MTPNFVAVSGLPRAGSTLLCQLLSMHPEIHSEGRSSPLLNGMAAMRKQISGDTFLLSQMDNNFGDTYAHLKSAMTGYLRSWYHNSGDKKVVIDKNRGWLQAIELLTHLAPEAKVLVCTRELTQIIGSIEAQHQKTIALDMTETVPHNDRVNRAIAWMDKKGVVGNALMSIDALSDLPNEVRDRVLIVRFEDLLGGPQITMSYIFKWLGLDEYVIDVNNLPVMSSESDSHYRMKYSHKTSTAITAPKLHIVSDRLRKQLRDNNDWYYQLYYKEFL